MHKLANIIDGVWQPDQGVSVKDNANVSSTGPVDHIFRVIASIAVAARDLSDEDHARIRQCILATGDLMLSRDRLKSADRQMFEGALRDAVARRLGY